MYVIKELSVTVQISPMDLYIKYLVLSKAVEQTWALENTSDMKDEEMWIHIPRDGYSLIEVRFLLTLASPCVVDDIVSDQSFGICGGSTYNEPLADPL